MPLNNRRTVQTLDWWVVACPSSRDMLESSSKENRMLGCALEKWQPGIGDPTILGWVTVLIYAVTAVLTCVIVVLAPFPDESHQRERIFWFGLFMILCALGINKQLDLQTLVTAVGRCLADAQGWYEDRKAVQVEFILSLVACACGLMLWFFWLLRGTWRRSTVPMLGLGLLIGFVLVRATSFQNIDTGFGQTSLSMWGKLWFELSGPFLIMVMGVILLKKRL